MRVIAVVFVLVFQSSCGGRELGWLVPRASIGVVLRSSDSGVVTTGYLVLGAPLSGPRLRVDRVPEPPRPLHLLGPGPPCSVRPLCRWELAASTQAYTELTREEAP